LIIILLFFVFYNDGWTKSTPPPADSVHVLLKNALHDKWFGEDKAHHFMASAFLTGFAYYTSKQELGMSQQKANVAAVGFSFSIGIGKEIYDGVSGKGHLSLQDLIADAAGVVLGVLILNVSSQ